MNRQALAVLLLPLTLLLTGCGPNLGDYMRSTTSLSICGMAILVADVYALINILDSNVTSGRKLLWGLVVFFMPFVGFILWFFFGPRR